MAHSEIIRRQEYIFETCPDCKIEHAFPRFVYDAAQSRKSIGGKGGYSVFCPNGHSWSYVQGESEQDKLRRERDLLKQRLAQKDDQISSERELRAAAERSAAARKGQVTRLKNRALAGVCPCCNRSFENLRRHMSNQHPTFASEEVA